MGAPLRVLIVEDTEDDARLVLRELRRGGFEVEWERVETAAGLAGALDRPWDVVLSDFRLPRFSAPEALALCRERGVVLPFIILSGTLAEQDAVDSLRAGAHDFVTKQNLSRLCPAITRELRDAEERRARAAADERHRELEDRYRLLIEGLPGVTYIARLEEVGTAAFVSAQVEALTGYTAAEVMAERGFWLKLLHPEDEGWVLAAYRRRRDPGDFAPVEYRIRRRDGREVWVRDRATLLRDSAGKPTSIQGLVIDITDMKAAEEQLARQRAALMQSEKLAAMGTLLAGVAHELNNPLAVVHGQATLLKRAAGDGPLAERTEKIVAAADRCARIVRNFLALARQRPTERQRTLVNQVIHEAVELLAYPLRVESIAVELRLAADVPPAWADAHQIHQVLVNLVTNAHHALRDSPPPRRITIASRFDRDRGRVVVEVSDSGPGIPADVRDRIFEPFFTTKAVGQGTGLGLSLCQGIIEGHGGTISVESEPGGGATFRFELPVEARHEAPAATGNAAPAPAAQGRRVLVVDDEPEVAAVLAEILSEKHAVDTARSGREGLERLEGTTYDLVLCDMKMPELDGPGFYRELERRHPHLLRRFAFVTGDAMSPDVLAFLERTGVPSTAKPFDFDAVMRLVDEMFEAPAV